MSDEHKYHLAGMAYCDCERGVDHEGDAEADAAWNEGGWVELERLYTRRHREEVYRLRAELEAVQDHAERLSCLLRGMARRSVRLRRRLSATLKASCATRSEQRYREALAALVTFHDTMFDREPTALRSVNTELALWAQARAALAEEAQR
jgi:hypothetical protein